MRRSSSESVGGAEAEDGFGAGRIVPEHFRSFDSVVQLLHGGFHLGVGCGQAFATVASIIHPIGIIFEIPDGQSQAFARGISGSVTKTLLVDFQVVDNRCHVVLPDASHPVAVRRPCGFRFAEANH